MVLKYWTNIFIFFKYWNSYFISYFTFIKTIQVIKNTTFKNLISDEYQTVIDPSSGQSGVYQVDPTITVGVGYETSFMSTSVDVDLLPVKSFKRFEDSQFLRAGVELNAANWVQLRLGVRVDLEDTRENVATVGFGLLTQEMERDCRQKTLN